MNPYLIGLLVYMVLISPVKLSLRIRLGRRNSLMFRMQLLGLPFYHSRKDEDGGDEQPLKRQQVTHQLKQNKLGLLRSLITLQRGQRLFRFLKLEWLSVYVHISQPDAMQNALLFGTLRTLADVSGRLFRYPLRIHLRTDYQAQGSEALLRCIFTLRLGSLLPAALVWLWYSISRRNEKKPLKEDDYAASH